MKKYGKIVKYVVILVFCVSAPILLQRYFFASPIPSNASNDGWAGFWGSFLGGIATLIAVMFTIRDNEKEREIEAQQQIEKSAIIVYYDIKFATDNVLNAWKSISPNALESFFFKKNHPEEYNPNDDRKDFLLYDDENIDRKSLDQLFINPNWIYEVAELRKCDNFKTLIKATYETYGYLQTISEWKNSTDDRKKVEANLAMRHLLKIKETSKTIIDNWEKSDEIMKILNMLKEIANIQES